MPAAKRTGAATRIAFHSQVGRTDGQNYRAGPLQPSNAVAFKFSQMGCWGRQLYRWHIRVVARTKIQGNHLTWHIMKDLPVLRKEAYARKFGARSAEEIVTDHVVQLTCT